MKILYDYQIMLMQKYGGVSRGFCEVAKRLSDSYDDEVSFVAEGSRNYYLEELFGHTMISDDRCQDEAHVKNAIENNQKTILQLCAKGECDVLHSTWYDPYIQKVVGCKHIVTIHDMIQENYPTLLTDRVFVQCKKNAMLNADLIVAVSHNTKQDILKTYPLIPANKIKVVYQGGAMKLSGVHYMDLPDEYILYIGARGNYKNYERFYMATERLMQKYPDLYLICVGGGDFTPFEARMMWNMKERVLHINASEQELTCLYANAVEFVFPSLYEGFGIPIIEAFSCGCPVLLSDASCFPEVAQDCAVYFDPKSIDDMTDRMERVMIDKELRSTLISKGMKRAEIFTWENSAKHMREAYLYALEM